jgi:hypothetical protein
MHGVVNCGVFEIAIALVLIAVTSCKRLRNLITPSILILIHTTTVVRNGWIGNHIGQLHCIHDNIN